ncbi:MAG: hypothetical protein RJA22_1290 [Verrucomicrobiota bacterium]
MTLLPIVGRELIEASRRRSTHLVRVGAAAVAVLVGTFFFAADHRGSWAGSGRGEAIFMWLAVLLHLYCLGAGVSRTADCLSEEKREGTLGLLFLTDLKGHDVVLGKLVATSLNAVYGALAVLPVLAIPLLAGGVAPADFARTAGVALNNLFFSLAVGMFCSAVFRDDRRSMGWAWSILLFVTVLLPAAGAFFCAQTEQMRWYPLFVVLSPGFDAIMAFQEPAASFSRQFKGLPWFEISVACIHGLSWLLLAAACWLVPRTWQDRPLSRAGAARRQRLTNLELGAVPERVALRQRLLDLNPVLWLSGRQRHQRTLVWLFVGVMVGIWVWLEGVGDRGGGDEFLAGVILVGMHAGLKLWLASEAGRRFSLDRASGALELILSTPLSVPEILRGQHAALLRQFGLPALAVLAMDLMVSFAVMPGEEGSFLWLCVTLVFVADMSTLPWVGMWQGLNSSRPNVAAGRTVALILVLPWVLYLVVPLGVGIFSNFAWSWGNQGLPAWLSRHLPVLFWVSLCVGVNVLFGLLARRRLLEEFRALATTRFGGPGKG